MKLYKYRSLANTHYVFDILLEGRLRCSAWSNLNDPMEGIFEYTNGESGRFRSYIDDVIRCKFEYKICSLSLNPFSSVMWAHYADEFRGLAIEVDLPLIDSPNEDFGYADPLIAPIEYRDEYYFSMIPRQQDPRATAKQILLSKQSDWRYEKEVRILSREDFFSLNNISIRVIAGPRMHQSLFDALKLICRSKGHELCRLDISGEGMYIKKVHRGRR